MNGIKLPHYKRTEKMATAEIPLPKKVKIPMAMTMGAPCVPVVKVGDEVDIGQKIGDCDAVMSCPVHSSVSGKVTAISDFLTVSGNNCKAVEIEVSPNQNIFSQIKKPNISNKKEFIQSVKESGVCGLGGAGFPTHIKLATKSKIDTLVINAAECEPYITSDDRQIVEEPDKVIGGVLLIAKYLGIEKIIIAIEKNKQDAIKILRQKSEKITNISVISLPLLYPQGAEKVLIYSATKRIVPEGKLPSESGVMVINVSTVVFLYDYTENGIPLISRRVTIDGDIVKNPCNVRALIGTPFENLLEYAQTDISKIKKLIAGGPMMGVTQYDQGAPVVKTTNAILVQGSIKEYKSSACIRCARCVNACPMGLSPTELERAYSHRNKEMLVKSKLSLCLNCGLCTYVCPAKRNLASTHQLAKIFVRE